MHLIGTVFGLGMLMVGFALSGNPWLAFSPETLVILITAALGFTFMAHGRALWGALGLAFFGQSGDAERYAEGAYVLQTLRRVFVSTGIATALIGGIAMSAQLDDWSVFGPAFAVLLLAPFYGVVFGELIVMPAMRRLEAAARA